MRLLIVVVSVAVSINTATANPHRLSGRSMGTSWQVTLARAPADRGLLQASVEQELQRLTDQMSAWEPDSVLSRFNRSSGEWLTLPDDLHRILAHALDLAHRTDGAYDPTVGPLVNLWGFGPDGGARASPPDASQIRQAQHRVGWQRIEFRSTMRRARQPGGMALDISSLGPGYAVDRIAALLRDAGHVHFLIDLGGEMRAAGNKSDGSAWRVAIERPDASEPEADGFDLVVALRDAAIGSSGDYRVGFEHAGRRYSHTIDPRSGEPVAHDLAAVSVIADEAMQADALAAALLVLGPEKGWRHARQHDIAAVFTRRGVRGLQRRWTPAFAAHIAR